MDEYSGKKGIHGMVVPRKGIGHAFRDTANTRHQNGPFCSRPGCSSKVNPSQVDQAGSSGKVKALKSSFRSSSSGKEAVGSSPITTNNPGKSLIEPQKTLSSWLEIDSSETSSIRDEPKFSELTPSPENFAGGLQSEVENEESSKVMMMEVGSCSLASKTRSHKNVHQKASLYSQRIKSTGPVTHAVISRHGLRNLRCNSISDVVQASCSSSDSNINRREDIIKKRNCEGESSSSARGKKMTGSSLEGRNSGLRNGISISDSRSRNITPHRDSGTASVRTPRLNSAHARGRLSSQVNENHITAIDIESPVMIPSSPHSVDLNAPGISYQNHTFSDTPLSRPSSYSGPSTSNEQFCGVMTVSPVEYGFPHPLINWDSFRHYNMDGIAEVLLALERIEHDEELTHETNLLLNGLNSSDHHRDMRLDIDTMSYEELLALEERMGSVSTALTEEALSECLKRRIYKSALTDYTTESRNEDKDDIKCCICQEEYVVGDEVGILQCQHKFHVVCIQQWLRLKSWCPICKVSTAPSNSSSPH